MQLKNTGVSNFRTSGIDGSRCSKVVFRTQVFLSALLCFMLSLFSGMKGACSVRLISPLLETPVETMSRFNNSHKSFGVESFIGSDELPLLDPWLEVFPH